MFVKKILLLAIFVIFSFNALANTPRSTGKYKNWESFVAETEKGKICFAQTLPTKRAPAAIKRDQSKLFVTFRPAENIKDEVSITSGHDYKSSSVTASSGKRKYSFFSQKNFAWLLDDQEEKKFIKLMKRATDLIVKARTMKIRFSGFDTTTVSQAGQEISPKVYRAMLKQAWSRQQKPVRLLGIGVQLKEKDSPLQSNLFE